MQKINITRNGNEIEIAPDFEKRTIITKINGKKYRGLKLNDKNQFVSTIRKIGVQLTEEQAQQIKNWKNEFDVLIQKEDEEKISEIKNKEVKTLKFKFHNYLTEKYMHTEYVELSNHENVYSEEGLKIMSALKRLSLEQLEKIGIERKDDIWQEISLSDENKKFILNQGTINEVEINGEMEKIEKRKEEIKSIKEKEAEIKKAKMLKKAIETGEKQLLSTSSVLADDGNLILIYTYIHSDGSISKEEFYDGD